MPPTERWLLVLTLLAALGCGLIGGVFFAFSSFVMKALERLAPASGIAAMQSINVAVVNASFLGVFFGTAALCAILAGFSYVRWPAPGSGYLLTGSALYLVGTLLVTVAFNVPRNHALAKAPPAEAPSAELWSRYLATWTAWNHVRTAAAVVAAASFSLALAYR